MTDDTSAALGRLREIAKRDSGIAPGLWSDDARAILAHIAALEARAEKAEAKVAAAEERGLVFNMLPDGRLDFCAIRAGSRLWDSRVRADALAAQVAGLREALTDLLSWFDGGPSSYGPWIIKAGEHGADDAVEAARQALAASPAVPEKPSGESGWLPAEPAAEWIEAMARAIDPHGCNWKNQLTGPLKDFARQQARAAYAALARQMGGGDAE